MAAQAADGAGAGVSAAPPLLEPFVPELLRFVRFLVGDRPQVEDIVQETMVRALTSLGRYDPSRPLGPWLRGIALKVTHKHWRRVRRSQAVERAMPEAGCPDPAGRSPEERLLERERADLLFRALDTLSPKLREALVLHVGEKLPAEEVARLTGSSLTAVYTRVSRAREAVRAFLGAQGRGDRETEERG